MTSFNLLTDPMPNSLLVQHEGAVASVTLNRPDVHNAFDDHLIATLTDTLKTLDGDTSVRVVVITGAGASFSAGADLTWMRGMAKASEAENRADALRLATLMRTLNFLSKPTIACVNGAAYGGGVGLIACCDIAITTENAKFGLTEVKLGLVPAVISPYVIAAIGERHARKLFLTGEIFDASIAQAIGLIHHYVAPNHLQVETQKTVDLLLKAGPVAVKEAKQLIQYRAGITLAAQERTDQNNAELIARLRVSAEGQEGLNAFLEKRKSAWIVP